MFVFNITTRIEKFKKLTDELGFLGEQNRLVVLVRYPTGNIGCQIKFLVQSMTEFDAKLYLATPIEVLRKVLIFGLVKL